jgi:hypothetical protein
MIPEPLVLVAQAEPRIEHAPLNLERPAPSVEQQQLADEVFSREQASSFAAILGVQTGLAVVQHLVAETFRPTAEEEVLRQNEDEPPEE